MKYLLDLIAAMLAASLFALPFAIYFTWMMTP